jgi:hypothetical protein
MDSLVQFSHADAARSLYLFCFVNGVSSTSLYESVRRSKIGRRAISSVALQCHCCLAQSPAGCVCMHPAMLCCVVSGCLHFVECRVDRVWVCVRRHYRPGHRRADGVRVRAAPCALSVCRSNAGTTVRHTPMTDRRDVRHVRRASMQTRKPVGGKCAF